MHFYRVIQMFVGYFAVSAFLKSTSTQSDTSLAFAMNINVTPSDHQFFDHQSTEQHQAHNHLRGRTESSISQQLTGSETGLRTDYRAYYPLNGDTLDYSGNAYHGTAGGGLVAAIDRFGRLNSCYHFDGSAYISGGCGGFPTAERTISLWFNPHRWISSDGRGTTAFSYGGYCRGGNIILDLNSPECTSSSSATNSVLQIHSGGCVDLLNANTPNPVDQWQHWVITTRASGTSTYVNGVFVASNGHFISNTIVSNEIFSIGSMVCGSSAPYSDHYTVPWYGYLDDVIIYDKALSDAEIYELYINQPPVLKNNQFSIIENTPFIVTSTMLSATDVSSDGSTTQQSSVQFIIKNIQNGYFELTTAPGLSVSTFTQQQIINNAVRFVPDGSQQAPTFNIKVSDGLLWTTPVPATITFKSKQPTAAPTVPPTAKPTPSPTRSPSVSFPTIKPTPAPSSQKIPTSQNNPPQLIGNLDNLSEQHTNLNKKQTFIIPLSIFKDPEDNAITLSMETDSTENEFSFSSKTNLLTFTPKVSGTQRFKFFATDSHDARSQTGADLSLITDTDNDKKQPVLSLGEIIGICAAGFFTVCGAMIGVHYRDHCRRDPTGVARIPVANCEPAETHVVTATTLYETKL